MHITSDKGVNAIALSAGVNITNELLDKWGMGCVELYHAISEWADIVTQEEDCLSKVLAEEETGWPGVFAYEVTESVGADIRRSIEVGTVPTDECVREWTRLAIISFCRNAENPLAVTAAYRELSDTALRCKQELES